MFLEVLSYIIAGFGLGLATAVIPGPIFVLLIVETLKYGWRAGAAVAAGPVLVDAFVMLPMALILQGLLTSKPLQVTFALAGMVFLLYLGGNMIMSALGGGELEDLRGVTAVSPALSFKRALTAQLLSPMAYAFWATAGAVLVRKAFENGGLISAIVFPAAFWVGTLTVAIILIGTTAAGRDTLKSGVYRAVVAIGGVAMAGFGVYIAARVVFE
ncbi:MAG: LysE family transporter [Actinomycetota bacterium]